LFFHILLQVKDKSSCEPLGYFYKWLANNLWNHCTYMQQENIWFKKKRLLEEILIFHVNRYRIWFLFPVKNCLSQEGGRGGGETIPLKVRQLVSWMLKPPISTKQTTIPCLKPE
jgi:hypothetical protein